MGWESGMCGQQGFMEHSTQDHFKRGAGSHTESWDPSCVARPRSIPRLMRRRALRRVPSSSSTSAPPSVTFSVCEKHRLLTHEGGLPGASAIKPAGSGAARQQRNKEGSGKCITLFWVGDREKDGMNWCLVRDCNTGAKCGSARENRETPLGGQQDPRLYKCCVCGRDPGGGYCGTARIA